MEKFKDLEYVRPDLKAISKEIKAAAKVIKSAKDYSTFKEGYTRAEAAFVQLYNAQSIASIRNDMDKTDAFYESEVAYLAKNSTSVQLALVSALKAVVKSKFRSRFDEEYGSFLTKNLEESLKLSNLQSMLLKIKEGNLERQYSKDAATCKTTFKGEECNFYGLLKHMESTDRLERKEAFEAWADLYESVSDKLDETYDKLIPLRLKIAKSCKYDNYIDYIYKARQRYEYTSKEVEQFRDSVRDIIVPVCTKLYKQQEERLGIDKMHFYDESLVFPEGNALPIGTKDELVEKARQMYLAMSKETGEYFNFMVEHELFDLETRPGKHLGGYCTFLPAEKAPFIFSNFNGTSADVDVLTHEAGHAFEAYTASRYQKSLLSVSSTSEINEIHSMSMEHFAYPYMESFFGEKADQYRYSHLCSALCSIPYLVSVDEFQHRVFEEPTLNAKERRIVWKKIEEKYMPWRDYDGNEFLTGGGFWMQKQHIFLYPFYYVDYALAQICAFQFFIRDRKDHQEAWNSYLTLCKEGGSQGYFELLNSVGLKSPFERETVATVTEEIEQIIEEFAEKI